MILKKKIYSLFLIASLLLTGSFSTLTAKDNCKEDAKKFCSEIKKGEGRVFRCLVNNYDQLSDQCKKKIDKKKQNWTAFKEKCGADLDKFCPNVEPGKGRIRACLAKNKDQISEQCKTFIKEKKGKKQKDELESISNIEKEVSKEE